MKNELSHKSSFFSALLGRNSIRYREKIDKVFPKSNPSQNFFRLTPIFMKEEWQSDNENNGEKIIESNVNTKYVLPPRS